MAATIKKVQSSDLSRHSKDVFAAAEDGPVIITRRDGEDLVLTSETQARHDRQGLDLAAQLIAASLDPSGRPFTVRLQEPFPWIGFLSPPEQEEFAQDVVATARACAAVRQFDRLVLTLLDWKRTAEAYASGLTASIDVEWLSGVTYAADPHADDA